MLLSFPAIERKGNELFGFQKFLSAKAVPIPPMIGDICSFIIGIC